MAQFLAKNKPDLVIADLPYGRQTNWNPPEESSGSPALALLNVMSSSMDSAGVIVLVARGNRIHGTAGRTFKKFKVGKRIVGFFRPQLCN